MELSKKETAYVYHCLFLMHGFSVDKFLDAHTEHVVNNEYDLNCKEAYFISRYRV